MVSDSIKEVVDSAIPFICVLLFVCEYLIYKQGPIKALGIQDRVVKIGIIGYCLINIPMCYIVAFSFKVGYPGIWIGILIAEIFIIIGFDVMIDRTNWHKQATDAIERMTVKNEEYDEERNRDKILV